MKAPTFEWDEAKNLANQRKHGVAFEDAQMAFRDPRRIVAKDHKHSRTEERFYCFGLDKDGRGILTVRFTYRAGRIRIIGAGYWREGKALYEQANRLH